MKLGVTGGAGFLGAHFLQWWRRQHPQDELCNLDALTYAGSIDRLGPLPSPGRYQFWHGDVCDPAAVRRALSGCEVVVHFAAETHVDRSLADASRFLRTNIEGTHVVLQQVREGRVARLVHVSTDEVYGPILTGAVDESAPLRPRNPYAVSKAGADLLAQVFHQNYALPVLIVRPTNIFGPGQWPEKLIALAAARALQGQSVPVYGDGQQRRMWLYVDDFCSALEVVIRQGQVGSIYNIASGTEQTNLATVQAVLAAAGASAEALAFVSDRLGHDRRYAMEDQRLRALGWRPKVSWAQGLQRTVAWYQAHRAWWEPLLGASKNRRGS
jgi:dTDP-glucose 4,6-dehydratase